jgi:hypothetical protein
MPRQLDYSEIPTRIGLAPHKDWMSAEQGFIPLIAGLSSADNKDLGGKSKDMGH